MSRKKGMIKITLCSDLCAGSGYAYEGLVDSDVCCNENGIPYIPARRLKGCLREVGELLRIENLNSVFGSSGSGVSHSIMLENAYPMPPEEYRELNEELTALRINSGYAPYLTDQKVLECYTGIRAQTKINDETGVAQDTSLRYTRVVRQYAMGDGEPLHFWAGVTFDCEEETLRRIVKGLRHIGLKRNRGLGNVVCSLEQVSDVQEDVKSVSPISADEYVELNYVVCSDQPLMLSIGSDRQTETYIGGTSVLGALSGAYLEREGTSPEDRMFRELFLTGDVIYTNLTPTARGEGGFDRYCPAPLFLNRLKKTKKLVNLLTEQNQEAGSPYDTSNGNQPKKLNGQYVCFEAEDCRAVRILEPTLEIVYHHSRRQPSADGRGGVFYSLEVLREGQYFRGSILAKRKYIEELKPLLKEGRTLRFGKSKSAQYGSCRVVWTEESKPAGVQVHAGETFAVVLESDGVFLSETGYTTRYEEVRRALAESMGLLVEAADGRYQEKDSMQTTVINGYSTVWNLKKASLPAVRAGSCFLYKAAEDQEISLGFAGEKNLEGFGRVHIYPVDRMEARPEEKEFQHGEAKPVKSVGFLRRVLERELEECLRECAWRLASERGVNCSASTLGRITLMFEESLADHRDAVGDAYEDFGERINSISREAEKKEGGKLRTLVSPGGLAQLASLEQEKRECPKLYEKWLENERGQEVLAKLSGLVEDKNDIANVLRSFWSACMTDMLVCLKYQKSGRKTSRREEAI